MTVVIAGCGDLGTEVGLRLAAAGHRILGLRRFPENLPAEFDALAVDLSRQVPALPADSRLVVIATAADARTADSYRSAYVDAPANTLEGLRRAGAGPQKVLLVSSTAVYGVEDGSWVDEDTATDPLTETGHVLVEAESALRRNVPDAVVFRLAGIYGPGRTRLIEQVREGTTTVPHHLHYTNRIHRDDAAAAIVHLVTGVESPAPTYIGVDDEPAPRADVLRLLADELGVRRPPVHEATSSQGSGKRCRNDLLRASGFEFTYPTYRQGYRSILAGEGVRHP